MLFNNNNKHHHKTFIPIVNTQQNFHQSPTTDKNYKVTGQYSVVTVLTAVNNDYTVTDQSPCSHTAV